MAEPHEEGAPGRTKLWAAVRVLLGLSQIMGATATLYFLVETGASVLTLLGTGITGLLLLVSKLLFRDRDHGS